MKDVHRCMGHEIVKGASDALEDVVDSIRDGCLECPSCKSSNLHHYQVVTYDRVVEDGPTKRFVYIASGGFVNDTATLPNPSGRRDGVGIRFWCEGCGILLELALAQHKGLSALAWRIAGDRGCPS